MGVLGTDTEALSHLNVDVEPGHRRPFLSRTPSQEGLCAQIPVAKVHAFLFEVRYPPTLNYAVSVAA